MSKTETPKAPTPGTLGWRDQAAENEALLHKGIRGKPVFLDQKAT